MELENSVTFCKAHDKLGHFATTLPIRRRFLRREMKIHVLAYFPLKNSAMVQNKITENL
jgi:hypothetical protein